RSSVAAVRPGQEAGEGTRPPGRLGRLRLPRHPPRDHGGPRAPGLCGDLRGTAQAVLATLASGLHQGTPRGRRLRRRRGAPPVHARPERGYQRGKAAGKANARNVAEGLGMVAMEPVAAPAPPPDEAPVVLVEPPLPPP